MKRSLLSVAILCLADPALASGVRAGNVAPVCTENFIRVDDAPESPKLAE